MRVLQVNKFLYGGAGAETVMFRTADLLRANGHEVSFFAMQDPRNEACAEAGYFPRGRYYGTSQGPIGRARDAAASIYSLEARKSLRRLLRDRRPDVAHLHNVYHQLTLSVVDELAAQRVPIVMTLHDYKPVCPSYTLYVNGAPCHRCVTGHPGHAVAHRCIKGSAAASLVGAAEAFFVRLRKLYHKVDAFISPSRYLADVMIEGGLPADRIHVIPNFVAEEQFGGGGMRRITDPPTVVFVGRLADVKGIRVLLAASSAIAPEVTTIVVGHGPLEAEVRKKADNGTLRFLGHRNWNEIAQLMDGASALVVPSLWEENCPMVVLEAGARGCAVVASDRGGLKELVSHGKDGFLFAPGDSVALSEILLRLGRDGVLARKLGEARCARTIAQNAADVHLTSLLEIYDKVGPGSVA